MPSQSDAEQFPDSLKTLDQLIDLAKKAGADAADAIAVDGRSASLSWRDGKLEDAEGSEGEEIGLRVFIGKQQAFTASSDRSKDGLKTLVDRTLAMAKAVPEDPYCGMAPKDRLFTGEAADLDLVDTGRWSPDELTERAREADEAARSVQGVTNTDGGGASGGHYQVALATSDGFSSSYQTSSFSVSVSAHAEKDGAMERDYDYSSARHREDVLTAGEIGKSAGEKAVKRLGAVKMQSGQVPVIFDPRVANSLLGHLVGAVSGTAIALGTSFLRDSKGEQVFADSISVIDDPLRVRGLKSKVFDGEGVATTKTTLVDSGVLQGWLLNSATARQLELPVTGHATRGTGSPPGIGTTNLYMAPGSQTPAELMADITEGLYVTELIGMGVNGVTGDYSRGAAGFRIVNGQLDHSVSEVTIAGNLKEMFKALTPASDLEFHYGINAPTLRIDGMTLAGA